MKKSIFLFLTLLSNYVLGINIKYTLDFPKPETHYIHVSMTITDIKTENILVKMPTWTPGSYLIREFAKHLEDIKTADNSAVKKINKNTWELTTKGKKQITINYKVYANELSVRTSFVNIDHAYINSASVLLYVNEFKNTEHLVVINKPSAWSKINTSLSFKSANNYLAKDYDNLVDCPIEIGNHNTFEFTAGGTNHKVAMYGKGNYVIEDLKKDMSKITETATQIVGENPNKEYNFIIHNLTNPSGGLEHMSSTTLQVNRFTYSPFSNYKGFLALVAHEYFHLWNVKRIRPNALGPFNYDEENYTNMLWLSEGFTSYYEERILHRAGFETDKEYIDYLANTISSVENTPGARVQSAADASFDAWIKGYRPHENSGNTTISYYGRGEVIAASLDLLIAANTKGKKNLDDLMKYLYNEYYKKQNRGFTDDEFKNAVASIAEKNVDDFFANYIYGTQIIDYNTYLKPAGLELTSKANNDKAYFGASLQDNGGKLMVKTVTRGSTAYVGGLNAEDEIIALDGFRVNADKFNKYFASKKNNDKIKLTISRDELIKELEITVLGSPFITYAITIKDTLTEEEKIIYNKWLK